MLAPEYLDRCADGVIALYQRLDESIARDIARRLVKMGEITDTARWQAEQLQHAGLLYDDVIAEVAKYSGASETAVRRAFEDAGVESVDAEIALYREAGISLPPLRQSARAWSILQAALKKTSGALWNLTLTTAAETQQRFIAACTLAEMQVSSGMLDYQTAIRRAVEDASRAGASVLYPSGHADKLDVAVRRAVLTGVNQTCGQISETLAREFGCDLMELTAHAGARPSHAVWQGQIVSLSGRRGYLSLSEIGYGTGAGFQGWNCRHSWNPFFEGISARSWTPEKLERLNARDIEYGGQKYTAYEISQMQRKMEREIRATKRALSGLDEAGFKAEFAQQAVKLKRQEAQLKAFARETGGRADTFRTQVQGFGRGLAQKAVWANKKEKPVFDTLAVHGVKYKQRISGKEIIVDAGSPKITGMRAHAAENLATKADRAGMTLEQAQAFVDNARLTLYQEDRENLKFLASDGYAILNFDFELVTAVPQKWRKKYDQYLEEKST